MNKLSCIPKDYYEHLLFLEDGTSDYMANRIQELCSHPADELNLIGFKASNFIFQNKTPKRQIEKVIAFLHTIL